ncbi:MAG: ATP synthase F1 subunit delta [Planctomycetota bacterium]
MEDSTQHETVLDIGAEQLGKVYARALLASTQSAGVSDQVLQQLGQIVDEYVGGSPELAAAFASPRVEPSEKRGVIDRLFGQSAHPILVRMMKVMVDRGRLGYLSAVRDAAVQLHDETLGRLVAEVRTAVPLTDQLRSEVSQRLSTSMGKEVRLEEKIDESLIGGMVVRVGDTIFDNSVAGRLQKIGTAASKGFARTLIEKSIDFTSVDS